MRTAIGVSGIACVCTGDDDPHPPGARDQCPIEAARLGLVAKADPVDHPAHYTQHPSGVECIQVTEHMGFNLGNAMKYIWRADLKGDAIEDLRKARWYLDREIARRGGQT